MNQEFVEALDQLERERGIAKEVLIEAVEAALVSAIKRDQRATQNVRVQLDPITGEIKAFNRRTVVEEVLDEHEEISLAQAKAIDPHFEIGDVVEEELPTKGFGRIAAQTAKQVVVQRIREAERALIFDEFSNRVGDIVTGIVQRYEQRNVFIDLGKVEGILPPSEQMPGERYEQSARLKVFIVEVKRTTKGPQVVTSRTRPGLLKRLFELEVPEIQDGLVEIKAVAREPGARSKIAVYSREPHVDPVGACVGARGNRVQMIVRELKGEKIDIIPWYPDAEMFVAKAMSPARVAAVQLAPSRKIALVVVPDHQLSLAIGREGQNARLAAKLTGWKIDIRSESQIAEMSEEELEAIIPFEDEVSEEAPAPVGEEPAEAAESIGEEPLAAEPEEISPVEEPPQEVAETLVEEEEERPKEAVKRKTRKDRIKPRDIELELEAVEDTGLGFFSDVLGDRQQGSRPPEAAPPAQAPAGEDVEISPIAAALAKSQAALPEETPIALALKKAGKSKPAAPPAKSAGRSRTAQAAKKAEDPAPAAAGESGAKTRKTRRKGDANAQDA